MSRRFNRLNLAAAMAVLLALGASCSNPAPPPVAAICPPPASASAATNLAALRAVAEQRGTVRVIARVAGALNGAQPAMDQAQNLALAAFSDAGVARAEALSDTLPFIVAEVTPEQLDMLFANENFEGWTEDRIAKTTLADSATLIQAQQVWELGGRGAGQAVAILDTGVDGAHPFLAGRVVAEGCFSTNSPANGSTSVCPNGQSAQIGAGAGRQCSVAGCDHGSHVAGIAAGRGEDFSGVAPDADIIAVQVFSRFTGAACGGAGECVASFTSDQIRALDFVLQQAGQRSVASVNMSLGGGRSTTACDNDLTKPVIDQLRAAGVAVAIASGNDGFRDAVSFPGCISTAVTVGATSKQDEVASFSNCSPQVDLHAPGVNINSSVPGGSFRALSGTSMATPHVAGAFAALRSLHPDATVDQIENALKATGLDVGGRPRLLLLDAANFLSSPASQEDAMVEPASGDMQAAMAQLAALPEDEPVRLIVRVNAPAGAQGATLNTAIASAEAAARDAGVAHVERLGSQPMIVVEATPQQARELAQSASIVAMQIDATARTQE